jgi:hypothetical protein
MHTLLCLCPSSNRNPTVPAANAEWWWNSDAPLRKPLEAACSGEFGDNFWLNPETIFFYLNRLDKRSFERVVARFHVGQIEVRQHVRKECQKFVAGHVPEKKGRDAVARP